MINQRDMIMISIYDDERVDSYDWLTLKSNAEKSYCWLSRCLSSVEINVTQRKEIFSFIYSDQNSQKKLTARIHLILNDFP